MSLTDRPFSRRQVLRSFGAAAAGLLLGGCVQDAPAAPAPAVQKGTRVAVVQATSYSRLLLRRQMRNLLDGLGGIQDLVRPGAHVVIKTNLTGGIQVQPLPSMAPEDSYVTHPAVVGVLCEFLRDAGAGSLTIVEAVYEWASYALWGYEDMVRPVAAQLIDLNSPDPYPDFIALPTGKGAFCYDSFTVSRVLAEADVFVSVAKMKCHATCGVTHALKNLVGIVPAQSYAEHPGDRVRSAFHVQCHGMSARLPRIIVDLNRARPIHLALIDGIKTMEGGEGPWRASSAAIAPGLLVAGKDAVAADAVATALQGFDPTAEYPEKPFAVGANHLNMAAAAGLGTNRLADIEIAGPAIADLRFPFRPAAGA